MLKIKIRERDKEKDVSSIPVEVYLASYPCLSLMVSHPSLDRDVRILDISDQGVLYHRSLTPKIAEKLKELGFKMDNIHGYHKKLKLCMRIKAFNDDNEDSL